MEEEFEEGGRRAVVVEEEEVGEGVQESRGGLRWRVEVVLGAGWRWST